MELNKNCRLGRWLFIRIKRVQILKSCSYVQRRFAVQILVMVLYSAILFKLAFAQDQLAPTTSTGTGTATSESTQVLSFDVGKQRAGDLVHAEFNIINESGGPLSFDVIRSCNCTKADTEFSIETSKTGQMHFEVRMPVNPQNVDVGLTCKDETRSIVLYIRLLASVEPDIVAEPKRLRLKSSSNDSFIFEIKSNFETVVVDKARVLDGNFSLESVEHDKPNLRLKVKHQPQTSPPPEVYFVVVATQVDGNEVIVNIPIEYEDVVRVSPSIVGLRDQGERYSAVLLLVGTSVPEHGIECVAHRADGDKKAFRIDQLKKRKENAYALYASIKQSEFVEWAGDQKVVLEVACSLSGLVWSSSVELKRPHR